MKITIIEDIEVYRVYFSYDPDLVEMVKSIPGRRYVPDKKYWTIPKDRLGFILYEIRSRGMEQYMELVSGESIGLNAPIESTTVIPNVDISDVPFYIAPGNHPFSHQLDFMKYAIHRFDIGLNSGFIVGDDMGTGKTLESLNLAMYCRNRFHIKRCLVICCVNQSKYNWMNDIEEHIKPYTGESGYLLGTRLKRNGKPKPEYSGPAKLEDLKTGKMYGKADGEELPFFVVTNVEFLRSHKGKKFPVTEELIRLCNAHEIGMIIIDEVHKNMSMQSLQGKQLDKLKAKTGKNVIWLPLTGTPIVSQPTDVYLPLKLVDGHYFSSFYKWCAQFCIYEGFSNSAIIGYKNIPKLKSLLQGHMIRRMKEDILDLPPKMFYTEYVENTDYQRKLADKVTADMVDHKDEILAQMNPLVSFLRLRQVNGSPELVDTSLSIDDSYIKKNAKLARLLELLEEIDAAHNKVIIFSNWVDPLRTLYKFVSKRYKTCCFTGTMSESVRQKHKRVFIENPTYTVLLGTIGALGTTHSFPGVGYEIFYDTPWTYVDRQQAEDRIQGIGRGKSGTHSSYYTLISKDTVDERVWDIMYKKMYIASYIVDNKVDLHSDPDMFMKLLGLK